MTRISELEEQQDKMRKLSREEVWPVSEICGRILECEGLTRKLLLRAKIPKLSEIGVCKW